MTRPETTPDQTVAVVDDGVSDNYDMPVTMDWWFCLKMSMLMRMLTRLGRRILERRPSPLPLLRLLPLQQGTETISS
jgi:hypothetical protein